MPFIPSHKKLSNDQDLIRLYKRTGDLEYVGQLFEKYLAFVYGVCLRYFPEEPAKDAAMQVFDILTDKLKSHEVEHFKNWLHVLTRNHCLMEIRSQKRKGGQSVSLEEERFMENVDFDHHGNGTDEDGFTLEENLQALEKCMETLSEEQRRSVDLFYLQEKSYHEIAGLTGYAFKKVKSFIQNGKRNLKICMEKEEHAG